ncbi:hypothetical protein PQR05_29510 [Paraburkholderia sediminicola]|uniref:hypothetical protein n=1 Tax=Paraburkholderia sediminicola TaxID=458836 RepID=UPI0038BAEC3F
MTLSTEAYLQTALAQVNSFGDKAISSDAMFVIDGYEANRLLTKQFPQPVLSSGGEIEVAGPMGIATWQPQQAKINQQGQISFYETVDGATEKLIKSIMALQGGRFDATIYEGTLENFTRGWRISGAFIQFDNPDRDFENRGQVVMLSGTLFYHYVGDTVNGNVKALP